MRYLILGILMLRRMTANELRRVVRANITHSHPDSPGAIQSALRRLRADGLVAVDEVSEDGRTVKYYTVTDDGRRAFTTWVCKPANMNREKTTELGQLLFMGLTVAERRLPLVDAVIADLEKQVAYLRAARERIVADGEEAGDGGSGEAGGKTGDDGGATGEAAAPAEAGGTGGASSDDSASSENDAPADAEAAMPAGSDARADADGAVAPPSADRGDDGEDEREPGEAGEAGAAPEESEDRENQSLDSGNADADEATEAAPSSEEENSKPANRPGDSDIRAYELLTVEFGLASTTFNLEWFRETRRRIAAGEL